MLSSLTPDIETLVIGGGVIGLAIAVECAKKNQNVYLVERNRAIGQEISSRSSEVIHAGIYYPKDSLRARLCVEGKHLLYAYTREHGVYTKRLGKLIVATSTAEIEILDAIAANAEQNGVDDLKILTASEARSYEPDIAAVKALFSPSTGIVDSHGLMQALERELLNHGGTVALNTAVKRINQHSDGVFEIQMTTGRVTSIVSARKLFVAAGLGMAELGEQLPRRESYRPPVISFAKGHYFALKGQTPFQHLVYPVPVKGGLGTHLTLDMQGNARFGPDVMWIDRVDYAFDDRDGARSREFENSIRRYWPALGENALTPSYTGIRPKISRHGEPARDFAIHGPRDHGIQDLVALYGIESPGLTSSLAIARYCTALLN